MKEKILELIKYGFFGVLTTVINYLLYIGMIELQMHYVISNLVSYSVAILLSYWFNEKYVFNDSKKNRLRKFIVYLLNRAVLIFIDNLLLVGCVEGVKLSPQISKIVVSVFLLAVNYLISKFVIFRKEDLQDGKCKE